MNTTTLRTKTRISPNSSPSLPTTGIATVWVRA